MKVWVRAYRFSENGRDLSKKGQLGKFYSPFADSYGPLTARDLVPYLDDPEKVAQQLIRSESAGLLVGSWVQYVLPVSKKKNISSKKSEGQIPEFGQELRIKIEKDSRNRTIAVRYSDGRTI